MADRTELASQDGRGVDTGVAGAPVTAWHARTKSSVVNDVVGSNGASCAADVNCVRRAGLADASKVRRQPSTLWAVSMAPCNVCLIPALGHQLEILEGRPHPNLLHSLQTRPRVDETHQAL